MFLSKTCTCGHEVMFDSNTVPKNEEGMWPTCPECNSTLLLRCRSRVQAKIDSGYDFEKQAKINRENKERIVREMLENNAKIKNSLGLR